MSALPLIWTAKLDFVQSIADHSVFSFIYRALTPRATPGSQQCPAASTVPLIAAHLEPRRSKNVVRNRTILSLTKGGCAATAINLSGGLNTDVTPKPIRMNGLLRRMFGPRETPLTPARRWGLVAGGLLTHVNQGGYESLWFSYGATRARNCLREGWSVSNEQQLMRVCEWLIRCGHRVPCEQTCQFVRAMQAGTVLYDPNHKDIELFRWVARNMAQLEKSRLIAWDFTRVINVARWGFTSGYIQEATAWQWIMKAAVSLQKSFNGWDEIGQDFLLGLSYWSDGAPPDPAFVAAYDILSKSPSSPWQMIPWRIALH